MIGKTFHFWLLLFCSLFISTLILSLAFQIVKAIFFLLLLAVLTPVIYTLLKYLISSGNITGRSDKLKSRQ
ncbi:hypothetical protein [Adhaeribacter aerolatus]|uniref:hypothetical protein n=1 Tax=Adhaeribacter aerolatus TaxID=670289 RepID=UPI0011BEB210|nr:hypothetical protein [Adhaeribacter aerolatus]